jgi:hypothetical protein
MAQAGKQIGSCTGDKEPGQSLVIGTQRFQCSGIMKTWPRVEGGVADGESSWQGGPGTPG